MATLQSASLTEFLSELTLLLEENIALHEALDTLRQYQSNRWLLRLMDEIRAEKGNLANALAKHPNEFEPFLVDLLRESSDQTEMLKKIVEYRETMESSSGYLNIKLLYSFSYFVSVLSVFTILITIILGYVVPVFANLFADFGADLPYLTQLIVQFSDFIQDYLLSILVTLLILLGLFWKFRAQLLPHFPIFGHLYYKLAIVRFLRTSAFMLSNGAPQNKAIESAALAMGISLQRIQHELAQNVTLSEALAKMSRRFPKKLLHLAAVGEKTKKLDKLFTKFGNIYTKQLHRSTEPTMKLLGVLLTVVLGILIGLFVVAIYIPIFNMGKVI